jgi:hypothetical protein
MWWATVAVVGFGKFFPKLGVADLSKYPARPEGIAVSSSLRCGWAPLAIRTLALTVLML